MTVASGATRLRVVRRHHLLFGRLLEMLAEDGFLRQTDAGWRVVRDLVPEGDVEEESARLLARFPVARPELTLLRNCGGELVPALRGEANPLLSLLVGGGWTILEGLYAESPPLRVLNTLAGMALESAIIST